MSATSSTAKLFQPTTVGNLQIQHRVVLAPLTRFRADKNHVHGDIGVEYYRQRSSTPGTLLITEATFIAPEASGYDHAPGLWSPAQIAGWKRVTDAVHANGSFIFAQLWALGRTAEGDSLRREPEGPFDVVGAGDIGIADHEKPRPLGLEEIELYKQKYVISAKNAIAAGFDGVEIHGANGYLVDQFLQDISNNRTDQYGGSIENRARFALEVVDGVAAAIGPERTAIRISPWSRFQEMRMEDPVPTFSYLIEQLKSRHPNLAYLHVIEGNTDPYAPTLDAEARSIDKFNSNEFARKAWLPRPYITGGGYSEQSGVKMALQAAEHGILVAFGRSFLANPDLPLRLMKGIPLNKANFSNIYDPESAAGYIDYPFADETQ